MTGGSIRLVNTPKLYNKIVTGRTLPKNGTARLKTKEK